LPPGKRADHLGIKIQFIGRIDMVSIRPMCENSSRMVSRAQCQDWGLTFSFYSILIVLLLSLFRRMRSMRGGRIMILFPCRKSCHRRECCTIPGLKFPFTFGGWKSFMKPIGDAMSL
jgi:hypothetical protein